MTTDGQMAMAPWRWRAGRPSLAGFERRWGVPLSNPLLCAPAPRRGDPVALGDRTSQWRYGHPAVVRALRAPLRSLWTAHPEEAWQKVQVPDAKNPLALATSNCPSPAVAISRGLSCGRAPQQQPYGRFSSSAEQPDSLLSVIGPECLFHLCYQELPLSNNARRRRIDSACHPESAPVRRVQACAGAELDS